jgi:crotonobetainyl-CoA:carnitine CoA-transferase CaiB-like acyl-CoA transferase
MAALEDVRVIDLTEALAGPYCTMILGDLGADVIKIERPGLGDQSRKWGPPFIGTESAYFLSVNRNKRSVALDIKSTEGRDNVRDLLQDADVFVCNVRKMESLREAGLDPETICTLNPRLIYCSISAYGRTGPYAGRGGYDLVAQGEAGLMEVTGEEGGEPMRWPVAISDLSCGLWSASAILAALYAREKTGQGQFIDQALLEGQLSWASVMACQYMASNEPPARLGNRHANIVPYQVFKAKDKHMIIAVGTQGHWQRFCKALHLGDAIRDDPKFITNAERLKNREELCAMLDSMFAQQNADYWLDALRAADIPSGPVNALQETLKDPQVQHRGMIVEFEHPMGSFKSLGNPVHLSETPVTYRRRPPMLGEHTEEVLAELDRNRRITASAHFCCAPKQRGRAERYAAVLDMQIERGDLTSRATTINISESGCAVRWLGQLPRIGDQVTVTMEDERLDGAVQAIVRWVHATSTTERTVGLEMFFDGDDDDTNPWASFVATLACSGVRAA